MDSFWEIMESLQTEEIMAMMQEMQIGDLITDPYFLGGAAALAILALFMKWRGLLAIEIGVIGFAWLLSRTLEQGAEVKEVYSDTLLVFIGGGVVVVAAVIYLLFLKSD